jgi:hypothetical protein
MFFVTIVFWTSIAKYVLIVVVWLVLFCMLRTCPNHPFVMRLFGSMAQPFTDGIHAAEQGLTQQQLSMFPVFKLPQPEGSPDSVLPEDRECAICLCAYEDEQPIKRLFCRHHYHSTCIDQWLSTKVTCPLCNSNVLQHLNPPSAPPLSPQQHTSLQLPSEGGIASSPSPPSPAAAAGASLPLPDIRVQLPQQTDRVLSGGLPLQLDDFFDGQYFNPVPPPPSLTATPGATLEEQQRA